MPAYVKLVRALLQIGTIHARDFLRRRAAHLRAVAGKLEPAAKNPALLTFAFDCDRTLMGHRSGGPGSFIREEDCGPIPSMVAVLLALHSAGHHVIVWSGGGVENVRKCARVCGFAHLEGDRLDFRAKPEGGSGPWTNQGMVDVAFDDGEYIKYGKVNVVVSELWLQLLREAERNAMT
ncbi:MAG: hypothetical protein RLZZ324_954 [Candidatus Parcubacteria bacterium]|jgi:hypothetical protein